MFYPKMEMNSMAEKWRALNRDGSDNIDRSTMRRGLDDMYHILLSMRWGSFFGATLLAYLVINLIFGGLYFLIGDDGLHGVNAVGWDRLVKCFFFSVQTFSTIGYGTMAPQNLSANILVSIEAFTGMLSIAMMSGLLFARFSRPTAKVRFSDKALITNHRGQRCFVFRMANARLNQVAEAQVSVVLLKSVVTPEGQSLRIQYDMPLIRDRSLFFAASWLVAHVIDESSPLYGMNLEALEKANAEVLISLSGFDETFSQTIHGRFSYLYDEILCDRQFDDMVERRDGKMMVNLEKLSDLTSLP